MNDEQLKAFQEINMVFPVLHFPTVLGAAVPTFTIFLGLTLS